MSTSTPSTSHGAGTAATDSPAAIEAGIKANDDRAFEESLGAMSPFEVKNLLVKMAKKGDEGTTRTLLNAGRGNPNWITTLPREAFFLLGAFALEEARRTMDEPDFDLAGMPAAEGAAARFLAFLDEHGREKPAQFLKRAWDYLDAEGLAGDELVHEWTGGIVGDEYPMPDRILRYTQEIVNRYLVKALDDGHAPATPYDLFATEGGTAAMCYLFYSLKCNFLVNPGDRIALMTPIFTPYLNIPTLNDYDLDVTYIQANTIDADGLHTWQYPDSELEKLRDPSIKLLCLVNPSNPPSVALDDASRAKLVSLVKNERPDLIIISDDVYGTFVPHYRSLLDDLPYNTACVYSFSKYFGATGWRLAVIATAQNNVFDDLIAKLPDDKKRALANRYACLTDHIEKVKFTDRMVADSRLVALNGTAGLGTPQQVMMSLFALYCLLDDHDAYRTKMQQLVQHRLGLLWKSLGWTLEPDPERAGYYSVIDLSIWATRLYGADFFAWLKENYDSLDIVVRLAQDTGVVLMDGHGFDAPEWSVRVSLANLNADDYIAIGQRLSAMLADYAEVFQDVVLFDDTVMGNIRLGRVGATDEEVLAAARAAMCDEFVSRMPQGYDTMIGENGGRLSGGERQRISIARAILKDAPVVLLDEATASLDVENETQVQQALSRLLAGKTVLVIAHRMRTVANADKIVVLKEGRVAEQGAPAELMAREGGLYRRMVELQTEASGWSLAS